MDVYGIMRKVPGGMLLVPMIIFAIINTLFPTLWSSLGSMSQALFSSGTLCIAGFLLFASGTSIKVNGLGQVVKRSAPTTIAKLAISFIFGFAFIYLFGIEGVLGINGVAFVSVICACNPGVYMGCIQDYGEPEDMGNFAILNILTTPAIPMLIIATASGAGFDILEIVSVLIPFVLGLVLGNIDPKISKMFQAATPLALPFLGMCFGSSINLATAIQAGIPGLALSAIFIVIHVAIMLPADRFIGKRPGYAAMAMSSVAGIAMATPSMLGEAYAAYAQTAVAEIALAVIVTSIVSPFITKAVAAKWGAPCFFKKAQEEASSKPAG